MTFAMERSGDKLITFFLLYFGWIVEDGGDIQDALLQKTGQKTVPSVFVNGVHIGGCDKTFEANQSGHLQFLLTKSQPEVEDTAQYDYDLVVIGGGSGGLAASKVSHCYLLNSS